MKWALSRAVLLIAVLAPCSGCNQVLPLIIWAGKTMLHSAAAQATVKLLDRVLGEKSSNVSTEVTWSRDDVNRGVLSVLKLEKQVSGRMVTETFQNVPVMRGPDGNPKVEKYYSDTVIEPKLKNLN